MKPLLKLVMNANHCKLLGDHVILYKTCKYLCLILTVSSDDSFADSHVFLCVFI